MKEMNKTTNGKGKKPYRMDIRISFTNGLKPISANVTQKEKAERICEFLANTL